MEEKQSAENADELAYGKSVIAAETIIRAWRDPIFRSSLPKDLLRQIPDHPSGVVDLIAAELDPTQQALPNTYATECSEGWRCLSVSKCQVESS